MADNKEDQCVAPFHYIWAIENCPALLSPRPVVSPMFTVEDGKSQWRFRAVEKGDYLAYIIQRQNDSASEVVNHFFEVALLNTEGHGVVTETFRRSFKKCDIFESPTFARIHDIFVLRRSDFLTNETLTFRFSISAMHPERFRVNLCYARTRLAIQRRSFVWVIKKFSSLSVGQGVSKALRLNNGCTILLTLFLTQTNGEETLAIHIALNASIRYKVRLSVLDFSGEVRLTVSRNRNQYDQEEFHLVEKSFLMANRDDYLPFDTLTLRCEYMIGMGIEQNGIEGYRYLPRHSSDMDGEISVPL